jgi:hypothetical protein
MPGTFGGWAWPSFPVGYRPVTIHRTLESRRTMKNYTTRTVATVVAALLAAPLASHAESQFVTGAGALTANARVDFQITIPRILFLRVGTGALNTTDPTINLITFSVPAANVGNGTAVAATAGSGDVGNGTVSAVVRGNGGNVSLSAATAGAINNGAGDSINWTEITTTAAAWTTGTTLAAPTLSNGTTTITLTAVNRIVNQDARWTYNYANTALVPAGTYGGVNTNNGRVTYTASLP